MSYLSFAKRDCLYLVGAWDWLFRVIEKVVCRVFTTDYQRIPEGIVNTQALLLKRPPYSYTLRKYYMNLRHRLLLQTKLDRKVHIYTIKSKSSTNLAPITPYALTPLRRAVSEITLNLNRNRSTVSRGSICGRSIGLRLLRAFIFR
jgi:hypothetical protein